MVPVRVWRYGRDEELAQRIPLRAGPLSLWREGGHLCSISLGDTEILRRIYSAVRDRNWGTVAPEYKNVKEDISEDSFQIVFDVENKENEIDFPWKGSITGEADGTIRFEMDGTARSTFLRNRIGFCILHPDSCAGVDCRIIHPDDTIEDSVFPELISPHQPFLNLKAIRHHLDSDIWAEVSFEGDIFETEDQRNWTDASFKTYCTPLSIPFPVEITAGTRIRQVVTLKLVDRGGKSKVLTGSRFGQVAAEAKEEYYRISISAVDLRAESAESTGTGPAGDTGEPGGKDLPRIGLGMASHGRKLAESRLELLKKLHPAHLRVDLNLDTDDVWSKLAAAADEAASIGAKLEPAIFLSDDAERELKEFRNRVKSLPCAVSSLLIFHKDEISTTEKWVKTARDILEASMSDVEFVSGSNAYFTELNRGPKPGPSPQALVYSVNPQIHMFDNASIMETLCTQPTTVESARAIGGGRPVIVSPITLKPRFNVVATGPEPPVPPGELPPQVDPRQMSLFTAAWTLGSVARLSDAGVESATYFETTGWRGVMETEDGSKIPERFPSIPGMVFPVYHVLADIAGFAGGQILETSSSAPLVLYGLTVKSDSSLRTLIANLSAESIEVRVKAPELEGKGFEAGSLRILDENTVEEACKDPAAFRNRWEGLSLTNGELRLQLLPYAVASIDWEE